MEKGFVMKLSDIGNELIGEYQKIDFEYTRNELAWYTNSQEYIKRIIKDNGIKTVLDYGCGDTDHRWNCDVKGLNVRGEPVSLKEWLHIKEVYLYEPSRNVDERRKVDMVISSDVLEHVHITDLPNVIRDMADNADKMLVAQVACYQTTTEFSNGEDVHITIREPNWWSGVFETIMLDYPHLKWVLITNVTYREKNPLIFNSVGRSPEGYRYGTFMSSFRYSKSGGDGDIKYLYPKI
jgi:hypothetical protein